MAKNDKTAKEGSTVKVHYTGSFEDGKVFDSSEGREPMQFTLGESKLIKGFESAVVGMKEGEEKTISLEPKDAYGERNDKLQQEIPVKALNIKGEPKPGMVLTLRDPQGHVAQAFVTKVGNGKITIDLNHPLAGKNLKFKIKIVETS